MNYCSSGTDHRQTPSDISTDYRKKVKHLTVGGILVIVIFMLIPEQVSADPYGRIPPQAYLTGRFSPQSHPDMVSLDAWKIAVNRPGHYLRREAAEALKRMSADFAKEHPRIKIRVVSAFRGFDHQKGIWAGKWKKSEASHPSPSERAAYILRYSSMPGTSRHHWGTDFDINSLENRYFESGEGKVLFQWLEKNAATYGFCRPYTAGRSKGYLEEKWHWSYRPLSSVFLNDWIKLFHSSGTPDQLKKSGVAFPGSEVSLDEAHVYVSSVSENCK